jgi:hypothetical protein
MISAEHGGGSSAYRETLLRFAPLVQQAETVVPGHGPPMSKERALEVLSEDIADISAGSRGEDPDLPASRRTGAQRRVHERNLEVFRSLPR